MQLRTIPLSMKKFVIIIIAVLCAAVSHAQFDRSKYPTGLSPSDLEKVNPDDIPDESQLKELGFSDEEIKQAMEIKQKKLSDSKEKVKDKGVDSTKTSGIKADTGQKKLSPKNSIQNLPPATIYGQEFFRNGNIKFYDRSEGARVPENYVLAAGDQINIAVWGYSDYNEVFTISSDGSIQSKGTGRIYLKGMKFSDARALLIKRFSQFIDLSNSKIEVTVVYSRVITVNIVGEVINPGSYTIPAINTAFNALMAAQGPNAIGSVRKIFIRRAGKTIKTLDIYQFLLNPESNQDFFLEDNDYIFVPPITKVVTITGEVKKPASYELLEKENMHSLINFAGGLSPFAYKKTLQVKRVKNNAVVLADVDLDSLLNNKKDFEMVDGDIVSIRRIPDIVENYVEIVGAVKLPGMYALKQGEKISDLIDKAQGFLDEALLERSYLLRQKEDLTKEYIAINLFEILNDKKSAQNLELRKHDLIEVFSKKRFMEKDSVGIYGAVRIPGKYPYGEGMTLSDIVTLAGGLTREAANNRVEISRVAGQKNILSKDTSNGNRTIVSTTTIGDDLNLDQKAAGFNLREYDQVFVRHIPNFGLQENVVLTGEVKYPGIYSLLKKNETLNEIIARAGGLTDWAFPEGAKLFRQDDSLGFLFIDLNRALRKMKSEYNYVLKEGDQITVPTMNDLVSISGAINYPGIEAIGKINTPFKGKRAGYYIRNYGLGFSDDAKKRKTYVVEANGFVHKTTSFGFFKIYPRVKTGSVIYAVYKPVKVKDGTKKREPVNWNRVIENTTIKITGLVTLWLLITQLSKR